MATQATLNDKRSVHQSADDGVNKDLVRLAKRFVLFLRSEESSFLLADQVPKTIERFVKQESIPKDDTLKSLENFIGGARKSSCRAITLTLSFDQESASNVITAFTRRGRISSRSLEGNTFSRKTNTFRDTIWPPSEVW